MTTRRMLAVSRTLAVVMVVSAFGSSARAAEGEAKFGGQWWSQTVNEAKYQEFRQVPHGGLLETYLLQEWGGRTGFSLWGANPFYKVQAHRLTLTNGVRWRADHGYTQIPHDFSNIKTGRRRGKIEFGGSKGGHIIIIATSLIKCSGIRNAMPDLTPPPLD